MQNSDSMNILTEEVRKEIDHWVAKFPEGKQQSAVLMALRIVQKEKGGWLDQNCIAAVAEYLSLPKIAVYEVATFYTMFHLKPIGRYKISVCKNISCMLCGCEHILDHLKKRLNINVGETTQDGKFTLVETECLASCIKAPVLQINDDVFHENLTFEKVDEILESLE